MLYPLCIASCAFQWQSRVFVTEIIWPAMSEIFSIFTEKFANSLSLSIHIYSIAEATGLLRDIAGT